MIEIERKYIIKSKKLFDSLVKKSFKKILIAQWYDFNERYRLVFDCNKKIWTKNSKIEISKEKRIEEEEKINETEINFDNLSKRRVVVKERFFINNDPEIIIDNLINLNNKIYYLKPFEEIQHLLEIEQKSIPIDDFENELKKITNSLEDIKEVTFLDGYNNAEFAGKTDLSPREIIKTLENWRF
jgi:hypothetical protein